MSPPIGCASFEHFRDGELMLFPGKGTIIVNLEGRIAYASTYFCDLMGIDFQKVKGMPWFDFVCPDDMDEAKLLFEAKKPDAPGFRFKLRRSDGVAVWVDIQGTAIRTPSGEACAITVIIAAIPPPD